MGNIKKVKKINCFIIFPVSLNVKISYGWIRYLDSILTYTKNGFVS